MNLTSHADHDLLTAFSVRQDAGAFRILVERHGALVYGTCLRVCGNVADAEDAVQECFLELARQAAAVRGSVPAWLHVVARRVAMRWRLHHARQTNLDTVSELAAAVEAPTWEGLAPRLDAALAELPEEERSVLILHYLEGRTQEEVAALLQLSQPTVHRRLQHGLELLRRRLLPACDSSVLPALLPLGFQPLREELAGQAGRIALGGAATTTTGLTGVGITTWVIVGALTFVVTLGCWWWSHSATTVLPTVNSRLAAVEPVETTPVIAALSERVSALGIDPERSKEGFNPCREGIRVTAVEPEGTAAALGVRNGDILVRLAGRPLTSFSLMKRTVEAVPVGADLTLEILRDGVAQTLRGTMQGPLRNDDEVPYPWPRFYDPNPLRRAFYAGSNHSAYEAIYDASEFATVGKSEFPCLRYQSVLDPGDRQFGTWMTSGPRSSRLAQLRGKRVRFSADLKTKDVTRTCGLWIRTDTCIGDTDCYCTTTFDNMGERGITGTTDWHRYAVVIDVPNETIGLPFGVLMNGPGIVWLKDPCLEEVGNDTASTSIDCTKMIADSKRRWDEFQAAQAAAGNPAPEPVKPADF